MSLEDLLRLFKRHRIYFVGTKDEAQLAVVALEYYGVCFHGDEPRDWQNFRYFAGAIYATNTGKNWTLAKSSRYCGDAEAFLLADFLALVNGAEPGSHDTLVVDLEEIL